MLQSPFFNTLKKKKLNIFTNNFASSSLIYKLGKFKNTLLLICLDLLKINIHIT